MRGAYRAGRLRLHAFWTGFDVPPPPLVRETGTIACELREDVGVFVVEGACHCGAQRVVAFADGSRGCLRCGARRQ